MKEAASAAVMAAPEDQLVSDFDGADDEERLHMDAHLQLEEEDEGGAGGRPETSMPFTNSSFDAKLLQLLRNLCTLEFQVHSEASNEFIGLLKGHFGGELLHLYANSSPSFTELMEAWRLRQGKPGMAHVFSLFSAILDHPDGKFLPDSDMARVAISRRLDKLARSIVESKMSDVYAELNSKDAKRQRAALSLMAAVVRRSMGLAAEVARSFDFKLPGFAKLAESHRRKKEKKRGEKMGKSSGTRQSFIDFAMSFLEVGNPRLLRWILQQKDMYFGVLCELGTDEDATVIQVLSTLRDRVLNADSLVPSALQSVLFGSVTLEQLSAISAHPDGGPAAELAHEVLLLVCTDPSHGLMPGLITDANPLKGNPKRLVELMKKAKATEIEYHKDLLLAIVSKRPSLLSAYMDEFPYILEPRASPSWYSAISLVSDLISYANLNIAFGSVVSNLQHPPAIDNPEIQCILKCIIPRSFTRLVINRGLLHSEVPVRHGSLRLLLEALKQLSRLISSIDYAVESISCQDLTVSSEETKVHGVLEMYDLGNIKKEIKLNTVGNLSANAQTIQKFVSLKKDIQDEVRALLPDSQVLLKLLSRLSSSSRKPEMRKRGRAPERALDSALEDGVKKKKYDPTYEGIDILVNGVNVNLDSAKPHLLFAEKEAIGSDTMKIVARIWSLFDISTIGKLEDAEAYFHSKLLDVLAFYLRTIPNAMDGSFDFLKILPSNPLMLSVDQQRSTMSLLIEFTRQSPGGKVPVRAPTQMYKHLQPLIDLLVFSPVKEIENQIYVLAKAAMLSTGAFNQNPFEIEAWFSFLPGYIEDKCSLVGDGSEICQELSTVVVSFFCDAVSTMGNNLHKQLDHVRSLTCKLRLGGKSPDFSPLALCILQKLLRLLESDSSNFKLYEKCLISTYVTRTLVFLSQTLVEVKTFSALIDVILSGKVEHLRLEDDGTGKFFCEWRPLKSLLHFSRAILKQQACSVLDVSGVHVMNAGSHSLLDVISEVRKVIASGHSSQSRELARAFFSSIICSEPLDILNNLPELITMSHCVFRVNILFLSSILFNDWTFLYDAAKLLPDIFIGGLKVVGENYKAGENYQNNTDVDSLDSSVIDFSLFLKGAPLSVLFPAIICIGDANNMDLSQTVSLLKAKLSKPLRESFTLSLRMLLFWADQVQSTYRSNPSHRLEQLFETCINLIEHVFERAKSIKSSMGILAEIVFAHPAFSGSLSKPLSRAVNPHQEHLPDNLENLLYFSKQSVHLIDTRIMLLSRRIAIYLLSMENAGKFEARSSQAVKALQHLVKCVLLIFRDKFALCMETADMRMLLPNFYVFHSWMQFICPYDLLELVNWLFSKIEQVNQIGCTNSRQSALSIVMNIAHGVFDVLANCLYNTNADGIAWHQFFDTECRDFDSIYAQFCKVYSKVIEFASYFRLESADICLLKAVNCVYRQIHVQTHSGLVPLAMGLLTIVISSPQTMLSYLLTEVTKIKGKVLFQLTYLSPLHLDLFAKTLLSIINEDLPVQFELNKEDFKYSEKEFMILLPAALTYLNSCSVKFGNQYVEFPCSIPLFYSKILFNGISNWNSFANWNVFEEEFEEIVPESVGEFMAIFSGSILGKAIYMLQYYFVSSKKPMKQKKLLKLIDSLYQSSKECEEVLLNLDGIDLNSFQQSLNFINKIMAEINIGRMLLFPEDSLVVVGHKSIERLLLVEESCNVKPSLLRFYSILVVALNMIVSKFPLNAKDSKDLCNETVCRFFRYLELFILRVILQISTKIQTPCFSHLDTVSLIESFARSSLINRFDDPTTLRALRGILSSLSNAKFPFGKVLNLVLAHSQFVPSISWSSNVSDLTGFSQTGSLLRPVSSVLDSNVDFTCASEGSDRIANDMSYLRKLEIIKLLRVLFYLKAQQQEEQEDVVINSRELISLLLSHFSAIVTEMDLEIYHLMCDVESAECSVKGSIAEMDYLWGISARKVRREETLEQVLSSNCIGDCETIEERRKRLFRENLPVDSKLCAATVQHFCFDLISYIEPISLTKIQPEDIVDMTKEISFGSMKKIQRYNPAFILRFSIHGLLMGYIDAVEFSRLGLLAVALISISSPDEGVRKLGYESLQRFKEALEKCQNGKEKVRLRLLLTYLQNGIMEPWQKIPSIAAIFAAEASAVMLDPLSNHCMTVTKFLLRSPKMDLKTVPLFHMVFRSSSVHFKKERVWILRQAYAGLNSDDDAQIFMKKFLFEILMSFFISSLADEESKYLIVQIMMKAVKLPMLTRNLVESCGLIPWLSSVLSLYWERLCCDCGNSYLRQMVLSLYVVRDVLSSKIILDWLETHGSEQLSELSSKLHFLLLNNFKPLLKNIALVDCILHILLSTSRISQKRKIYQPRLSLSLEALYNLCCLFDIELSKTSSNCNAELRLDIILLSAPPKVVFYEDKTMLSKLIAWAVSTALKTVQKTSWIFPVKLSDNDQKEDSISILLRWLSASAILGRLSRKSIALNTSFILEKQEKKTLLTLLEMVKHRTRENIEEDASCDDQLAATILYLQQLLGKNCGLLPSVVSALCLLHFDTKSLKDTKNDHIKLICSKIRSPPEANPAWSWSYYQPWKDSASEYTELQKIEEIRACQMLLHIFSSEIRHPLLKSTLLLTEVEENKAAMRLRKWGYTPEMRDLLYYIYEDMVATGAHQYDGTPAPFVLQNEPTAEEQAWDNYDSNVYVSLGPEGEELREEDGTSDNEGEDPYLNSNPEHVPHTTPTPQPPLRTTPSIPSARTGAGPCRRKRKTSEVEVTSSWHSLSEALQSRNEGVMQANSIAREQVAIARTAQEGEDKSESEYPKVVQLMKSLPGYNLEDEMYTGALSFFLEKEHRRMFLSMASDRNLAEAWLRVTWTRRKDTFKD